MAKEENQGELSQLLVGNTGPTETGSTISSTLDDLFKNAPPPMPVKQVVVSRPAIPVEPPVTSTDMDVVDSEEDNTKKQKKPKKDKSVAFTDDTQDKLAKAKAKRARKIGYGMDEEEERERQEQEEAEAEKKKRTKKNLLGRMPQDPDALKRTLFLGNLSVKAITDSSIYGQLKALCGQYGKIKAIRFRSIAFSEMLPRKVAFIRGKFHSERQTCNAYVEFTQEDVVQQAVDSLNGSEFADHHLRADSAGNEKPYDMKRSVFVGNLDFAAEEEDLWKHFATCGKVENVRIIRDPTTSMGKGFGYVQFSDRAEVSLALKLHDTALNERKLRVQRASEKALNEKKKKKEMADGESQGTAGEQSTRPVFEGTRSVKGDKPSNKRRRTERSKAFAEKRLNRSVSRGGLSGDRGGSAPGRGGLSGDRGRSAPGRGGFTASRGRGGGRGRGNGRGHGRGHGRGRGRGH